MEEKKSYRDELIEEIRSVGRELINRAEEFVGPELKYCTSMDIDIHISGNFRGEPTDISITTGTFNTEKFRKEGWL